MKIVFASDNPGKLRELQALIETQPITVVSQNSLGITPIEETAKTFIENALLKARHAAMLSKLPTLADDSGLVVPALNGLPGIYSARFAGLNANAKANIDKLLQNLAEKKLTQTPAWFYCVMVFMQSADDPAPLIGEGVWRGEILPAPRGEGGFGYDPIFYVRDHQVSAAELPLKIKNNISHRAIALKSLLAKLSGQLEL